MKTLLKILSLVGVNIFLTSCATKQVIVIDKSSDIVRIGSDVKGHVYVWKNGQWTDGGKCHLPEGWYAGPGPK